MIYRFFVVLIFFLFPLPLFAATGGIDVSSSLPSQSEKRGLFSTMDSIKNQKIKITETESAIALEKQNIVTLS